MPLIYLFFKYKSGVILCMKLMVVGRVKAGEKALQVIYYMK